MIHASETNLITRSLKSKVALDVFHNNSFPTFNAAAFQTSTDYFNATSFLFTSSLWLWGIDGRIGQQDADAVGCWVNGKSDAPQIWMKKYYLPSSPCLSPINSMQGGKDGRRVWGRDWDGLMSVPCHQRGQGWQCRWLHDGPESRGTGDTLVVASDGAESHCVWYPAVMFSCSLFAVPLPASRDRWNHPE